MLGEGVERLVGRVYEAAGDESLWPGLLVRLRDAFGASTAGLINHSFVTRRGAHRYTAGVEPRHSGAYESRFSAENPWLGSSSAYQPGRIHFGHQIVPNWELVQTRFYREYLKPLGSFHRLCGVVDRRKEETSFIVLHRPYGRREFDEADRRLLGHLLPHVQRALQLHWDVLRHRLEHDALLDVLDRLPVAVLLVDREARTLLINAAAEALLAEGDGLLLVSHRLATGSQAELRRLRRLIEDATAGFPGPPGRARTGGGQAIVSRPSGRHPLVLTVLPAGSPVTGRDGRMGAVAAVIIKNSGAEAGISGRELAALYHLTPAEIRLAILIFHGCGLFDAAARIGISRNTARSHMKRIYAKTGTRRQADLVRLLGEACLRGPSPEAVPR